MLNWKEKFKKHLKKSLNSWSYAKYKDELGNEWIIYSIVKNPVFKPELLMKFTYYNVHKG